jgi:hypothetical protein
MTDVKGDPRELIDRLIKVCSDGNEEGHGVIWNEIRR